MRGSGVKGHPQLQTGFEASPRQVDTVLKKKSYSCYARVNLTDTTLAEITQTQKELNVALKVARLGGRNW